MKKSNFSNLGKIGFIVTFFAAFVLIAISSCDPKPPKNSRAAQAQRGKVHFQKYCSACHGEDGKGVIIDSLDIQPANLTSILTRERSNEFPILEVANFIDGRRMSKAHGTRAMPIWGEVFSGQEYLNESQIKGKLGEIIAYLMIIQE